MHLEVTIVLNETPVNDVFLLLMVMRVGREVSCLESEIKSFMKTLTASRYYPAFDRGSLLLKKVRVVGYLLPVLRFLSGKPLMSFPISLLRHDRHRSLAGPCYT